MIIQANETTPLAITKARLTLVGNIAWPLVVVVFLLTQRRKIREILDALTVLLRSAKRVAISNILDIDTELNRTEEEAKQRPIQTPESHAPEVPKDELIAASKIGSYVTNSELAAIKMRMVQFAHEYEGARSNMKPGNERTQAMNAIVAKMRTLAIAANPFLSEFAKKSASPGIRLCAICILQLTPNIEYVEWLSDRMKTERPFVFYQASVALLAFVRTYGTPEEQRLINALTSAKDTVEKFSGGRPDRNTVWTLDVALQELGGGGLT
jgi:hypothetical protein